MGDRWTVEQYVAMELDNGNRLASTWKYDAQDPWSVHVVFWDDTGEEVPWEFARDLLVAGLDGMAGDGDVRLRPYTRWGMRRVGLGLRSPDGMAAMSCPIGPLRQFVAATTNLVPLGAEPGMVDVDATVARLLQGGRSC